MHDAASLQTLGTVTDALVAFLAAQTELSNQVPSLGLIHKIIASMDRESPVVQVCVLARLTPGVVSPRPQRARQQRGEFAIMTSGLWCYLLTADVCAVAVAAAVCGQDPGSAQGHCSGGAASRRSPQAALAAGLEMVSKIFEANHGPLVVQALECGLPQYLLGLLQEGLDGVENVSSTKALIVKALKAMAR